MAQGRRRSALTGAMALAALPAAGQAQVAPTTPARIAVNGVFALCPKLLKENVSPGSAQLARLGFEATAPRHRGELWFRAAGSAGSGNSASASYGGIVVGYGPAEKQCVLNYEGPDYREIAGVVRDLVIRNKLQRINAMDRDGAKAEAFQGIVPGRSDVARLIIIENTNNQSAAISYTERARP